MDSPVLEYEIIYDDNEVTQLKNKLNNKEIECKTNLTKLNSLKTQYNGLLPYIDKLKEKNKKYEKQIKDLDKEIELLNKSLEKLTKDNKRLINLSNEDYKEITSLKKRINDDGDIIRDNKKRIRHLEIENDNKRDFISILTYR
jgi:chromosome segregation ATPase